MQAKLTRRIRERGLSSVYAAKLVESMPKRCQAILDNNARSLDIPSSSQASSCKAKEGNPSGIDCFQPIVYHQHTVIAEIFKIKGPISKKRLNHDRKIHTQN